MKAGRLSIVLAVVGMLMLHGVASAEKVTIVVRGVVTPTFNTNNTVFPDPTRFEVRYQVVERDIPGAGDYSPSSSST